jgi:predicted dehydrogenase/threonine dehydrogenase-like Zn-dependent dehydrogenase
MRYEMIQGIIKKGKVLGQQVPVPVVSKGSVLIQVVNSCISSGTEVSNLQSANQSLIKRALMQPDDLNKFVNMVKSDGIARAYERVKNKIKGGKATGYSLSGIVIGIGDGVTRFKPGDKVAAAGAGIANHAEYVDVPEPLVTKIPAGLDLALASTVALGSIAMHAVRRANLHLGEYAVVFGTGIIGILCIQILRISGVRIAAIDIENKRLEIAKELGADICINPKVESPIQKIVNWSNGFGADAVLFTAATKDSDPLSQSFQMCRKKGKVILVGISGMNINRQDMYRNELDLIMSTSYGPGRYDKNYEEKGYDYPYAYVRWTEKRNMDEYLRLLNNGSIDLSKLITHTYAIENITEAFESFNSHEKKPIMIILSYDEPSIKNLWRNRESNYKLDLSAKPFKQDTIRIALVGAGNFATSTHLPNIKSLSDRYTLHAVMNKTSLKGKMVAEQYDAEYVTTNYDDILNDDDVNLIMITTRHDSHADLTLKALEAGKSVFVEKPLAVTEKEIEKIEKFFDSKEKIPFVTVGFNRRFSKYAKEIKKHTEKRINPLFIHYTMNAGYIPLDHWVHENGGRIVGEACHVIDLMTFLIGCKIKSVNCEELSPNTKYFSSADNRSINLKYEDGSIANILYLSVGSTEYPKEAMQIHFDGNTIVMQDYKFLEGYGINLQRISSSVSEKGQREELIRLHDTLSHKNPNWPIEPWDMIQTTKVAILLK